MTTTMLECDQLGTVFINRVLDFIEYTAGGTTGVENCRFQNTDNDSVGSGSVETTIESFQIEVILGNSLPVFNPALSSQTVQVGSIFQYFLPSIVDADGDSVNMVYSPTTFSWVNFVDTPNKEFIFSPLSNADVGTHTLNVYLSD